MVFKFLSSGGLGDAWVALLKIWDIIHDKPNPQVMWSHLSSHEFHHDSIIQLMVLVPGIVEANFHKVTKSTIYQLEARIKDEHTIRLRSTAFDLVDPCPDFSWVLRSGITEKFAVVQPAAGRDDNRWHFGQ